MGHTSFLYFEVQFKCVRDYVLRSPSPVILTEVIQKVITGLCVKDTTKIDIKVHGALTGHYKLKELASVYYSVQLQSLIIDFAIFTANKRFSRFLSLIRAIFETNQFEPIFVNGGLDAL